jgi:hypothetical protein
MNQKQIALELINWAKSDVFRNYFMSPGTLYSQ